MKAPYADTRVQSVSQDELVKRSKRFHFFQIVFIVTYVGIVLDVFTTALGYQKAGAGYEQNPLGLSLIGGLGWFWLLALLTAISLLAYVSCKVIQLYKGGAWGRAINIAFVVLALFRWLAVVTAVLYLLQPGN
jgi:hypothetical protein